MVPLDNFRRILSEMRAEQRAVVQVGISVLLLLPTLFIVVSL